MTTGRTSLTLGGGVLESAENRPRCQLPAPAFFRLRDVLRITSLSRPTIYRRIAANRFPAPIRLGGRACGWAIAELQTWISDPESYGAAGAPAPPLRSRPRKSAYPLRKAV